ncbi:hypothetical protein QK290_14980 [Pseudarthrobacter sp. AL07]|uniref:hypothetical protein n=1 Tax=unclassified Pseudarthrobacter TaxID=2647000 RepID=UPI00249AE161|nr:MULTISPECIES: hypothetical protein [unclassified Pseudarthrobacter]MDI3195678.1 hypothetical protein [Pseudarthrobacter sp. AL20]MDI3209773.1 hypothetical protein [Pseudarthrobacter sp. AL07]
MTTGPRPEIPNDRADSWRRSMALGISPDQHSPRHLHDAADVLELRQEHRLQQVMPALNDLLADDSTSGRHLKVLADARGEILWRVGSPEVLRRADRLEFSEGADWSEAGIGTNAISEALVTGRPVQLSSAEHLVRTHHEWACTAAPITDPATGRLPGRARRLRTAGHPQRGHAADGAVRGPGRGGSFGNARRRDFLECPVGPGCLPAGRPPAGRAR